MEDSSPSSEIVISLLLLLQELEINFVRHDHPPLNTVEESKAMRGDMPPGIHIKNMFLKDRKKKYFLLVAEEDRSIDLKLLQTTIGCGVLSFANTDRLYEMLGVTPGSVTPLSLINDKTNHNVTLLLDTAFNDTDETIYVHPLVNEISLGLSGKNLQKFFAYTGHEPKWLSCFC